MKVLVIAGVLVGLTAAVMAFGGKGSCKGSFGEGKEMMKIFKQLDLSSEQKSALKELKKSFKEDKSAKRDEMKAKFKAFKAQKSEMVKNHVGANGFDKAAYITEAKAKMAEKQEQMQTAMNERVEKKATNLEKIFSILTPEQRAKWIELAK